MRAVVHWFRSAALVGGLCALPSSPAVPSPVLEAGSANRPALLQVSAVVATPVVRSLNFVEASAPIALSSLRYGVRDAIAVPALGTRAEAVAAGYSPGRPQLGEPVADNAAAPDGNSMLALMLAGLGLAALVAARAPADRPNSATTVQNEPARF